MVKRTEEGDCGSGKPSGAEGKRGMQQGKPAQDVTARILSCATHGG